VQLGLTLIILLFLEYVSAELAIIVCTVCELKEVAILLTRARFRWYRDIALRVLFTLLLVCSFSLVPCVVVLEVFVFVGAAAPCLAVIHGGYSLFSFRGYIV
jgi:hypothetical protein